MKDSNDLSKPPVLAEDPRYLSLLDKFALLEAQMNAVYSERAALVAMLSKIFPSSIEKHVHDGKDWVPEWGNVCIINVPEVGSRRLMQLSWHISEADLPMFAHLFPYYQNQYQWDGHSTEEKYWAMLKWQSPKMLCQTCEGVGVISNGHVSWPCPRCQL